jgi:hypothetical protein
MVGFARQGSKLKVQGASLTVLALMTAALMILALKTAALTVSLCWADSNQLISLNSIFPLILSMVGGGNE